MHLVSRSLLAGAILLLMSSCGGSTHLKAFTTDGCSSFPDGTFNHKDLWLACCTEHDLAYWQGGTYGERLQADKDLRECVAQVGEPEIANLMLGGVRVGGTPLFPTRFRWGYGWDYPRWYGPLTAEERQLVEQSLEQQKP